MVRRHDLERDETRDDQVELSALVAFAEDHLVALEIVAPDHTLRVQTLGAGDELGWSALLMGRRKHFQARALERVDALAFDGGELLAACKEDPSFGFVLMHRLLSVVSERLQATRLQLHDMYSPQAKRAGA